MQKRQLLLVSGALITVGAIAALAAPPSQPDAGMPGMRMMRDGRGQMGPRGSLGPRSITADEYDARTRERFARLDKNSDGIIDAAEIEAAISERGRSAGRGNPGERLLQRFGDKDGKITKDAFLAEAKRRFAQLDLNNDGKITDDDLPPMMRGKGALSSHGATMQGPWARGFMRLRGADAKGDGIITLDAFLAAETKRFDDMDRNKDGAVDKADFEAMRKEMIAYRVKRFLHAYGADADGKVTKDQFFKVAKERFARLDRKGEGRITFGGVDDNGGMPGRGWFDGRGDRGQMGPDRRGPPPPPPKQ